MNINFPQNETEVEILLCEWFTKNDINSWYNRKIGLLGNKNVFTTIGKINRKPDIIILSKNFGYIAIEVKHSKNSKNIRDANKIIKYQQWYKNKYTHYLIDGEFIEIKAFIVATEQSIKGKLFDELGKKYPSDKWKKYLVTYGNEPSYEYANSKGYTRDIWATWRTFGRERIQEPGIGVLYSTKLDGDNNSKPKMLTQLFIEKKWSVRWLKL